LRRENWMKQMRQVGRIARDQSERALLVQGLEPVEQLPGDFKIDIDAETDAHQLIDFGGSAGRKRGGADLGEREIRLFPYLYAAERALVKFFVASRSPNDLGNVAA